MQEYYFETGHNNIIRIHFGEKMGSGFARIKEYCKKEKAPYPNKCRLLGDFRIILF